MKNDLLRDRAKQLLHIQKEQSKTLNFKDFYSVLEQLELYRTELELQNDILQNYVLEVEESRNKYTDLYDFIPFGYFILDCNGIILDVNEAGIKLLGCPKKKLLNRAFASYISPNYQYIFSEHRNKIIKTNQLQSCEIKLLKTNGSFVHVHIDSKPSSNNFANNKYFLLFTREISAQRQEQEYLHQQQNKMANVQRNNSINKIASVITHELNHPLAVISNYLHGCIRKIKSNKYNMDDILESLNQAVDQSHRAAEIVLRMKDFNCKGSLKLESIILNDLITEIITLINYEIADFPVIIQYRPSNNIPALSLDKVHIQQAILNLIRNAIDAMRDTNTIEPKIFIEVNMLNAVSVEICVRDNGPGLLKEDYHRIFDPYYTTKSYGVGLGLAVSRSIVETHGGKLTAEKNDLGRGSCFKMNLFLNNKNAV